MEYQVDPGGREVRELQRSHGWASRAVLEIGCGEGRLARRLAGLSAAVTAIDLEVERLQRGAASGEPLEAGTVRFACGDGPMLPFPPGSFDVAVFGWSL